MVTKSQLKALDRLYPLLGSTGVINVALVLCGARAAYIHDTLALEPEVRKKFNNASEAVSDEIVEDYRSKVTEAVVASFDNLGVVDPHEPMIYDVNNADKADIEIVKLHGKVGTTKMCRAIGRLLGYAGAFHLRKHPDDVAIRVMCLDDKKRLHHVFAYTARTSEVFSALKSFETFIVKARPLLGKRLAKDIVVEDFSLRIDGRDIEVRRKDKTTKLFHP